MSKQKTMPGQTMEQVLLARVKKAEAEVMHLRTEVERLERIRKRVCEAATGVRLPGWVEPTFPDDVSTHDEEFSSLEARDRSHQ